MERVCSSLLSETTLFFNLFQLFNIKKFSGLFQLQTLLSHKVSTIPLTQIRRTLWMMRQHVYLHNLGFVCLCSSAVRLSISIKRNTYNTPLLQHCWFHSGGYWWKKNTIDLPMVFLWIFLLNQLFLLFG